MFKFFLTIAATMPILVPGIQQMCSKYLLSTEVLNEGENTDTSDHSVLFPVLVQPYTGSVCRTFPRDCCGKFYRVKNKIQTSIRDRIRNWGT